MQTLFDLRRFKLSLNDVVDAIIDSNFSEVHKKDAQLPRWFWSDTVSILLTRRVGFSSVFELVSLTRREAT